MEQEIPVKPLHKKEEGRKIMSGILMMVIAIVVLSGAYLLYGRYLPKQMGHCQRTDSGCKRKAMIYKTPQHLQMEENL